MLPFSKNAATSFRPAIPLNANPLYPILLVLISGMLFASCGKSSDKPVALTIDDYRIFYDAQKEGYGTIYSTIVQDNDSLYGIIMSGNSYEDDEKGERPFSIKTGNLGLTWTAPKPFAHQLMRDSINESLVLGVTGPTQKGTLIVNGFHFKVSDSSLLYKDTNWRTYDLIIGRREKGVNEFTFQRHPSGTFMGEQFMERGIQLANGRLVYTIWGAKEKGENWRCGVLLSDDDGLTWRYRDVAYEPKRSIRTDSAVTAGFNEQTLFLTKAGKIVSIIRGRAKLGQVESSPKDTWYLRSESTDNGETWSPYETTGLAGTGAPGVGLVLPDGSFLQASRLPYSRDLFSIPDPKLEGLHLARSFDEGKTWKTEKIFQHDPKGLPFTNHYNAMNGQFLKVAENEWIYVFGQFDNKEKVYRILSFRIKAS